MTGLNSKQQLAVDAWQLIYHNQNQWDQKVWRREDRTRCGTKLCWGGHVVVLDGGAFVTDDFNSGYYDQLLARQDDLPDEIRTYKTEKSDLNIRLVSVEARLRALLGLSSVDLYDLVNGDNSIEDLRKAITKHLGVDPMTQTLVAKNTCWCGDPACTYGK